MRIMNHLFSRCLKSMVRKAHQVSKMEDKILVKKFSGNFNLENEISRIFKEVNDSFYICNLSDVKRKFEDWIKFMPRVKPFYAVKCNDDLEVLRTLASLGCCFDCASSGEIRKILSLNVEPQRIIFANPTKILSHIKFAKESCKGQMKFLTFDNEDEIVKLKKVYPEAKLVLRLRHSSDKATYKLGKKFGAVPGTEAENLLKQAKEQNLEVIGVSFHIGSSCEDYEAYCEAIKICRKLFEFAKKIGFEFSVLDIGGGFPGDDWNKIREFSAPINQTLYEYFPSEEFPKLEILSEPGRYFVESAFTLVTQIHSRKISRDSDNSISDVMYYLNEGVYSNFLFIPLGPEFKAPNVLADKRSDVKYQTTIWGPTCDSTDKVCENIELELLEVEDVLYFINMGAYTSTLRTPFNGFETTKTVYVINEND